MSGQFSHPVARAPEKHPATPAAQSQFLGSRFGSTAQAQFGNASFGLARDISRSDAFAPRKIQTKLTVNTPGDPYEQEADRIADQIMRQPATETTAPVGSSPQPVSNHAGTSDEPEVRDPSEIMPASLRRHGIPPTFDADPDAQHGSALATVQTVRSLPSGGTPLEPSLRAFFEPRFGHSFAQVRVHTDEAAAHSARALDALAYTQGPHIAFAAGKFEPHNESGRRLLAHELTHVVQQGYAGQHRIQRSYLATSPNDEITQEVPRPPVVKATLGGETPEIQRAPDPPPPAALAEPSLTFTPGDTLQRGDNLIAKVDFKPAAGEKLTVTGWQYTTGRGTGNADTVVRPKGEPKFSSEWQGVMALSGEMQLDYTVKPRGKPVQTPPPITATVTVNDRTGPDWGTTITDVAESPLAGRPSPPEVSSDLGLHCVPQGLMSVQEKTVDRGPNKAFVFAAAVPDRAYRSEPHIHPDLTNPRSAFLLFHTKAGLLFFKPTAGARILIPETEYTVVSVSGDRMTFSVRDWTAFYKRHHVYTVTITGGGRTVTAKDDWWRLNPNAERGSIEIADQSAVRDALPSGTHDISITTQANGDWLPIPLMPSNKILAGTRSHEYQHAVHSHRANLHKIVSALDPRRVLEGLVSTPSLAIDFQTKLRDLLGEIDKPEHTLVNESASKAAGRFVDNGAMAAVNQDPSSGASLGSLWDITHDQKMGPPTVKPACP